MDQVRRIVARALPGHALLSCEPVSGGALNPVYRIAVDGLADRFALRIYARDAAACRKEVAVHRLVAASVPVPEILFAEPDGNPPAALMRWIPGETWRQLQSRRDAREMAECGCALGAVLAQIASFEFARPGSIGAGLEIGPGPVEGPDAVPRMIELFLASPHAAARMSAGSIARVCNFAWRRAARLASLDSERFLVHSDFGSPNVVMHRPRGEWEVAAVLDWEFAFSGSPLHDVGHALRYKSASLEPHFSDAYRAAGGRLPDDWLDLARTLDLTALCEMLGRPALPDTVVEEIMSLIQATSET